MNDTEHTADQPMHPTRRQFLKRAGAATVVAAGGGVWWSAHRGVFSTGRGAAFTPWTTWRTDRPSGPLGIVHAGLLAASPHNTQPWLFRVHENSIELYADTARHLGSFDPFLREMHIGLGCAVENMVLAAAAQGYRADVALTDGDLTAVPPPANNQRLVARLALRSAEAVASPLHDAIATRRTHRGPYDARREVHHEVLRRLDAAAAGDPDVKLFLYTDDALRTVFGEETIRATEIIVKDDEMLADSHRWFRHGWSDLQAHKDGVHIDTAGVGPALRTMVKLLPVLPAASEADGWVQGTNMNVATARTFGIIAVRDRYDCAQALRAGRLWQRLHLVAASRDVDAQPLNQVVEIVDRDRQLGRAQQMAGVLAKLTGDSAWQPTFGFRMGYRLAPVPHSARRSVQDVVIA